MALRSLCPTLRYSTLSMHTPLLAPSLLAGDHANLASSARLVQDLGLAWLHVDIMDGHFVPNYSFGPETVAALRRNGITLFLDVHLMLDEPQRYVEPFAKAGANLISLHIEPAVPHAEILRHIRSLGCQNGIVLNPGTPASSVSHLLDQVDLVLLMTVQPGFGGQAFRRDVLPKMAELELQRRQRGLPFRLEVDGGIDLANASECRSQGVDTFVAGTSFFKSPDRKAYAAAIAAL